ncbi:MAG: peptidoglycan recognition family protein [Planctomycetota bacterium]
MKQGRRNILLAGLGLTLVGCEKAASVTGRPRPEWPSVSDTAASARYTDRAAASPPPQLIQRQTVSTPRLGRVTVLPRSAWTATGPTLGLVSPMRGVQRVTVHHEGWRPFYATDRNATANRLEIIRASHTGKRGWGDIGYHYVVDRAGRTWQARPLAYQGAHVKNRNEHNIGVLVLGNFEQQTPTNAQLAGLQATLAGLCAAHRITPARVHTHREFNPTACPGRHLQPRVNVIRDRLA